MIDENKRLCSHPAADEELQVAVSHLIALAVSAHSSWSVFLSLSAVYFPLPTASLHCFLFT